MTNAQSDFEEYIPTAYTHLEESWKGGITAETNVDPLYRCTRCAALVDYLGQEKHLEWHAILDAMMKQVHF